MNKIIHYLKDGTILESLENHIISAERINCVVDIEKFISQNQNTYNEEETDSK